MSVDRDPFPVVIGLREVAAKLGKSHSWLKAYLRLHPYGRKIGAKRVFTPGDYAALLASFHPDHPAAKQRFVSGRVSARSRVDIMSGEEAYNELKARLSTPKRRRPGAHRDGEAPE